MQRRVVVAGFHHDHVRRHGDADVAAVAGQAAVAALRTVHILGGTAVAAIATHALDHHAGGAHEAVVGVVAGVGEAGGDRATVATYAVSRVGALGIQPGAVIAAPAACASLARHQHAAEIRMRVAIERRVDAAAHATYAGGTVFTAHVALAGRAAFTAQRDQGDAADAVDRVLRQRGDLRPHRDGQRATAVAQAAVAADLVEPACRGIRALRTGATDAHRIDRRRGEQQLVLAVVGGVVVQRGVQAHHQVDVRRRATGSAGVTVLVVEDRIRAGTSRRRSCAAIGVEIARDVAVDAVQLAAVGQCDTGGGKGRQAGGGERIHQRQ